MDYTDLYTFQTSNGIIVPDDKSVLLGIQEKFQEIFGTDIDLSAETPVGRLIEAFAVMVKTTLGITAQNANQFNVNEATGIYLDSIGQIYGLKRIAGSRTKISIRCYFTDNPTGTDTIPAGSLIMSSATGALFRVDSPIVNEGKLQEADTGRYYGEGTATAVNTGKVLAPIGSVTSIQTGVMGWTSVTNIAPTYIGTDVETDEAFRQRILASRPIGIGFNISLMSALNRIEGVNSCCILENNTGTAKIDKGVPLPPHSIFVCFDGVSTPDLLYEVASEISRAKPVGIGMVREGIDGLDAIMQSIPYGFNDSLMQDIYFYQAQPRNILIELTYSKGNYMGENVQDDITEAISAFMNTIHVGDTVYGAMITNALINKLNIGISSIQIQKVGSGNPSGMVVELDGYEVPIVNAANIILKEI